MIPAEVELFPWAVTLFICAVAAVCDLRSRRIPNALTVPALLAGLLWAAWTGGAWGAGDALAAGIVIALPFFVLFLLSLGGAGDAKLMAAVGAWLGLHNGISALVWVLLCGGVIGLIIAVAKRSLPQVMRNVWGMTGGLLITAQTSRGWTDLVGALPKSERMVRMPYAVSILVGVLLASGGLHLWR